MSWDYRADWDALAAGEAEITSEYFEDLRKLIFAICQVSQTGDLHGTLNPDIYDPTRKYEQGECCTYSGKAWVLHKGISKGTAPPAGMWLQAARTNQYEDYNYNSGCVSFIVEDDQVYVFPAWHCLPPQLDRYKRITYTTGNGIKYGNEQRIQMTRVRYAAEIAATKREIIRLKDEITTLTTELEQLLVERRIIVNNNQSTAVIDAMIAAKRTAIADKQNQIDRHEKFLAAFKINRPDNDYPVELAIREENAFADAGGYGRDYRDIISGQLGARFIEYSPDPRTSEMIAPPYTYPYHKDNMQNGAIFAKSYDNGKIQAYQAFIEQFIEKRGDFIWPSAIAVDELSNPVGYRQLNDRDRRSDGTTLLPGIWNCSFSAFEKCLELYGQYDWYLDILYPPDPTMEKLQAATTKWPIVGLWRRTWKNSIGFPAAAPEVYDPQTGRPLIWPGEKGTPPFQEQSPQPMGVTTTIWNSLDGVRNAYQTALQQLTDEDRLLILNRHDYNSLDARSPYYTNTRVQIPAAGKYINYETNLAEILIACKAVLEKLVYLPLPDATFKGYKYISSYADTENPPSSYAEARNEAIRTFTEVYNAFVANPMSGASAISSSSYDNAHWVSALGDETYSHNLPPAVKHGTCSLTETIPFIAISGVAAATLAAIDSMEYADVWFMQLIPHTPTPDQIQVYKTIKSSVQTEIYDLKHRYPAIATTFGDASYILQRGELTGVTGTLIKVPFTMFTAREEWDGTYLYIIAESVAMKALDLIVPQDAQPYNYANDSWVGTYKHWYSDLVADKYLMAIERKIYVKINVKKIEINQNDYELGV